MPAEPTFRSDVTVHLVKATADDAHVLWSARVSTQGEQSLDQIGEDPARSKGLINYLMRDRHGSPFEATSMTFFVNAPIFVFREFMRHRVGWCIAGDTQITTESISASGTRTTNLTRIDALYDRWHNGVRDSMGRIRKLPSIYRQKLRVLNEGSMLFELGGISDVIQSGEKEVITLRTETGQQLECTADHAIFTNEGWVKAGELEADHLLTVVGKRPRQAGHQMSRKLREGINEWTMAQKNTVVKPYDCCYLCGAREERELLGVDHVVPVAANLTLALDVKNLAPVCRPCHKVKSATEQKLAIRGNTCGGKFVRYERVGKPRVTMTYDLSVDGPWHNFLANGIVVHNSYNEESGRYRELEPVFYVPNADRKLVQEGKPGRYVFVEGTAGQQELVGRAMEDSYRQSYEAYQEMLARGVAREVARSVLPVGLYSSMYATCNARSLMHFLGLRTTHPDAKVKSYPQREIEMVGEKMEAEWARLMPLTYAAFNANGRVAP
jgi:thymidylate synthase (FAD)